MKFVKMLPLLFGVMLAASSFTAVASINATALTAASAAVAKSMSAEEVAKPMSEEYLHRDTDDIYPLKFVAVGLVVALLLTAFSFAIGAGKNKG